VKHFTPMSDKIVRDHGLITAAVYGRMWRYSRQSKDSICSASQGKIADELGLSRPTVNFHVHILTEAGYLKVDKIRRNNTNFYEVMDVNETNTDKELGVKETNTGVKETNTETPLGVKETNTKIQSKKEDKKANSAGDVVEIKNIYQLYEQNIGILTPKIADKLDDIEKDYPPTWFDDALEIAVERNALNLSYIMAILKRWKADGKDSGKQSNGRTIIKGLAG